jgi:large subunit ribosomal protein L10
LAITKKKKDELVEQYRELIQQSSAVFLTQYGGMSVKEMEQLRVKLSEANGRINVTKNTLLQIALEESEFATPADLLVGPVATSFALGEAPALAKVLVDQAKANEKLTIIAGLLGTQVLTKDEIESLANLPSLDELRAQILGLINAPAQGILSVVANSVRQVVNVVDAYAKKEEAGAVPQEAEAAA